MVMVAAIALASSTYAWFVQSKNVKADGMKVQAAAESGIEISYDNVNWRSVATSTANTGVLFPTSTKDIKTWYHATANSSASKDALNNTYTTLTLDETNGTTDTGSKYFLLTKYKIRSATATAATNLTIDSVQAASTDPSNTEDLNKALRIAVVIPGDTDGSNQKVHIYAPAGGDNNYNIGDGTKTTGPDVQVKAANGSAPESTTVSVPNAGVDVSVYAWYEGEDTELKSGNIPNGGVSIDTMNVTVNFSATTN